jgi:phage gp29-like protein
MMKKFFDRFFRTPQTAFVPATAESAPSKVDLLREIAVADPKYGGLHQSGFYKQIIFNPDSLIGRKGLKVYSEMRRDEQIKSALFTKKYATIASGWEIVVDKRTRQSDKLKRFVEFCFGEMSGTVETFLVDVLTALDYGFSVTEPTYRLIEFGEFSGQYGFKALKVRHPEQIEFETDQFGNLTEFGILQGQKRLPANRFAIFSYRPEFSNFYGTSDLRECYRAWFVKNSIIKFMAMSLERYGQPIAVASTQTTLSDSEKTILLTMLKNLQSRSALVIPETIKLDFATPSPRVAEAFVPALSLLDSWIAMSILVPALIGAGGGADKVGSLARSATEFDTFLLVVEQLRNELVEFVNDRIVKVLLDLNYPITDGVYPKFKFRELTHERKIELIKLYNETLNATTLTKTREDEAFMRSLAGLPELPRTIESMGTKEQRDQEEKQREAKFKKIIFSQKYAA